MADTNGGNGNNGDHDAVLRFGEQLTALDRLLSERFGDFTQQMRRLAEQRDRDAAQANEWRGAINDMALNKLDRSEFTAGHAELIRRVDANAGALGDRMNRIETVQAAMSGTGNGRLAMVSVGAVVISLIGLVIVIVTHLGGA